MSFTYGDNVLIVSTRNEPSTPGVVVRVHGGGDDAEYDVSVQVTGAHGHELHRVPGDRLIADSGAEPLADESERLADEHPDEAHARLDAGLNRLDTLLSSPSVMDETHRSRIAHEAQTQLLASIAVSLYELRTVAMEGAAREAMTPEVADELEAPSVDPGHALRVWDPNGEREVTVETTPTGHCRDEVHWPFWCRYSRTTDTGAVVQRGAGVASWTEVPASDPLTTAHAEAVRRHRFPTAEPAHRSMGQES